MHDVWFTRASFYSFMCLFGKIECLCVWFLLFCGAWSLDNCPKVPETLGLSFPHPPVPESAFIRHIFASYNLYCKNIQKHIQASIFRKCIVLNLYFLSIIWSANFFRLWYYCPLYRLDYVIDWWIRGIWRQFLPMCLLVWFYDKEFPWMSGFCYWLFLW